MRVGECVIGCVFASVSACECVCAYVSFFEKICNSGFGGNVQFEEITRLLIFHRGFWFQTGKQISNMIIPVPP